MNIRHKLVRSAVLAAAAAIVSLLASQPARAWWIGGHKLMTAAAAAKLPEDMPVFFRAAGEALADSAAEPDRWKDAAAPHLRAAERPEHFIDLEYLDGAPVPELRPDLVKLYHSKNIEPAKGGVLPCSLMEGYERLMLAFHHCRTHPDSEAARQRALVYGGWVAHYAEDAAMPLHTTTHYDGKPGPNGQVAQKGIHARIDAYPEHFGLTVESLGERLAAKPSASVWPVIVKALEESHACVAQCYELDAAGGFDTAPEKVREFILKRARAATQLTLELWYSAWQNSAQVPENKIND
jgi:hypothetical protein